MGSKKIILAMFLIIFSTVNIFANNIRIIVEVTGVIINGGNVHVGIFTNERDHRRDSPFATFILESNNNILTFELELPEGECLVWAYQDLNSNEKLDTGFFGIPNEPVALSNYDGRGIPGKFNKHKVPVNKNTANISVNLGVIKF